MKIGIIGYGFVGKAVAQLSSHYVVNIYDPFVKRYSTSEHKKAAYNGDIVFVCVPTPCASDGSLDTSIVMEVASTWKAIKEVSQDADRVLAVKSTIPVGTIDIMCKAFKDNNIVHNPEFLTQRTAMEDFVNADEIIVGGPNEKACNDVLNVYREWFENNNDNYSDRVFRAVSGKVAEMVKVVRNSFYAVKVEFMNEVADLCAEMGIDYDEFRNVFARSGRHAWVNPQHTHVPGPDGERGFGGACLPKDSSGLAQLGVQNNTPMPVVDAAVRQNKCRRDDL